MVVGDSNKTRWPARMSVLESPRELKQQKYQRLDPTLRNSELTSLHKGPGSIYKISGESDVQPDVRRT